MPHGHPWMDMALLILLLAVVDRRSHVRTNGH